MWKSSSRAVCVLFVFFEICWCNENVNQSELILTFLVHRHGDRSPLSRSYVSPEKWESFNKFIEPYGYGELTEAGIERCFKLGEAIRRRYNDQLSNKYSSNNVYVRSTEYERCKMCILSAMNAIYPPEGNCTMYKWRPVPYSTLPMERDYLLSFDNCRAFEISHEERSHKPLPEMMKYKSLYGKLRNLGYDIEDTPMSINFLYEDIMAQIAVKFPVQHEIIELLDEMRAIGNEVAATNFGYIHELPLLSGVLLNEFFTHADMLISGQQTQKIRIYSSHDVTVYPFEAITRAVPQQGMPQWCSYYSLELRKNHVTGKYFVLPVYLPSPYGDEKYLRIDGCDEEPCSYDRFKRLTEPMAMNVTEHWEKCEDIKK